MPPYSQKMYDSSDSYRNNVQARKHLNILQTVTYLPVIY